MTKEDNIIVPRWFLENVENTLRIQNNINLDKETGETCQDRNIRQSLNGLRKLLKGEELTGRERFERLQPSLPSDLDEAARKYGHEEPILPEYYNDGDIPDYERWTAEAFKAGAEWMAGQGWICKSSRPIFIKGYEQAEKDLIPLVQLWVDSGDANVVSFQQFLKCHETQGNK